MKVSTSAFRRSTSDRERLEEDDRHERQGPPVLLGSVAESCPGRAGTFDSQEEDRDKENSEEDIQGSDIENRSQLSSEELSTVSNITSDLMTSGELHAFVETIFFRVSIRY